MINRITNLDKILLTYIIIAILGMFNLNLANKYFRNVFLSYAETQSNKLSSLIISKSISYELENYKDFELINYDLDNNKINGLSFDTISLSKIARDTTKTIYKYLIAIENGDLDLINKLELDEYHDLKKNPEGIIYEIPFGIINNSPLLASFGPNIPVSFKLLGDVINSLEYDIKSYGINSVMITLLLNIKINIRVIIPLVSKTSEIENKFPIAMKLLQGEVPSNMIGSFPLQ